MAVCEKPPADGIAPKNAPAPQERPLASSSGPRTAPVPGLLILRLDGPLYTANVRSVNRKIIAAVAQHPGNEVVVLDATALARVTLTVTREFAELERELHSLGAVVWIAALSLQTLETSRLLPRWSELVLEQRMYPTSLAEVPGYRARGDEFSFSPPSTS